MIVTLATVRMYAARAPTAAQMSMLVRSVPGVSTMFMPKMRLPTQLPVTAVP